MQLRIDKNQVRNALATQARRAALGGLVAAAILLILEHEKQYPHYRYGRPPFGMVTIPAGRFTMGDTRDRKLDSQPVSVRVSAFHMDGELVTFANWTNIYSIATNRGYEFSNPGSGKAWNHPVHTVNWFDCVKWCNARSQLQGLVPVYYTDTNWTRVFTNGEVAVYPKWSARGYRLPTEAEWEKAARGGHSDWRFPWGNTIDGTRANYHGSTNEYDYDLGPDGFNAPHAHGRMPYTSPSGLFPPNDYGLFDMAGDLWEWCWDWYWMPYEAGTDSHGPALGVSRVVRGGSWYVNAILCQTANREHYDPTIAFNGIGFRCVLPAGQ